MTPLHRLQRLYQWDNCLHLSKLGKPSSHHTTRAPQTNGIPGWLCLTRDEGGNPITLLVSRHENPATKKVRCVIDERCYEDTILRVEYTSTCIYLADIWMWNGSCLFYSLSFSERICLLEKVHSMLYTSCPLFETYSIVMRNEENLRGYEYYSDKAGEKGIFEPVRHDDMFEIVSTEIPDVYKLTANGGYLRVRTLALSRHLRTLGSKFKLRCKQNEDGTWTPVELSHLNTNGQAQKNA